MFRLNDPLNINQTHNYNLNIYDDSNGVHYQLYIENCYGLCKY